VTGLAALHAVSFVVVAPRRAAYLCGEMLLRLRPSGFIEPCLPSTAERPPVGPNFLVQVGHQPSRAGSCDGCYLPQRVINAKSATARRPAPCALFLSSSPTTRATARTKATASAERRPGAPAEALSQRLARRPGAGPREYALLQLPAGMQKLVRAACRLAHAAPGSDKRRWMDQSWRARLYDVDYARFRPARQ
jgi:hypothetical protein